MKLKPWPIKLNSRRIRTFPELGRFETDEQRAEAFGKAWTSIRFAPFYLAILIGWILGAPILVLTVEWHFFGTRTWSRYAGAALVMSFYGMSVRLYRKRIQRSLRVQLLKSGIPICIDCGYDLTGNESGRCPECGKPFRLSDWYSPPIPLKPQESKPAAQADQSSVD